MFDDLRRRIAFWVYPELKEEFKDAERDRFFRDTALTLRNWCVGDIPVVHDIIEWVDLKTRAHFMSQEEFQAMLATGKYKNPPPIMDLKIELRRYVRVGEYDETFR